MDSNSHLFGCVPNHKNPALLRDIQNRSIPWDAQDKPSLCTWESLKPFLEEKAKLFERIKKEGRYKNWWEIANDLGLNPEEIVIPSQGNIGSCAGVSYFDRCFQIQLLKQIQYCFSEQNIEKVNSLVTWLISTNWDRTGGQTISAVVQEGCETGIFPASMVGEYSEMWYDKTAASNHDSDAKKRQMGACLIPEDVDKVEVISLALKAGHVVEIGNATAVKDGTVRDQNGIYTVSCRGRWAHATMFSESKTVNGTNYYRWENSHGFIYPNDGTEPRIGGWMTEKTLKQFTSSTFCDLAVVTYVESPYDESVKPSLNPNGD